ncbi:hypothetical protein BGZ80_011414 [Entomortierella chlamydospora]|uniref:F-box domain-containing protein n=1 Tax=Entomortierella chlamydospora TaxID=101097 RepID=A0A9P6MU82_9FUNG|nr:hypothetical protein BGZ80_011414 [Entomortierella chlamydospora]
MFPRKVQKCHHHPDDCGMATTANPTGLSRDLIFGIPIIVDQICCHLSNRDIYRCCLVSRDFCITFSPNIFSIINIQRRVTFKRWALPVTQTALRSKIAYIRSITTVFGETYSLLYQFVFSNPSALNNLTELRCRDLPTSSHGHAENLHQLPRILSLIESSRNLRLLELGFFDFDNVDYVERLGSTIRKKGRRLHDLHITGAKPVICLKVHRILWSSAAVQRITLNLELDKNRSQIADAAEERQLMMMALEALQDGKSFDTYPALYQGKQADYSLLESELMFEWTELHLQHESFDVDVRLLLKALRHCPLLESLTIPGINVPLLLQEAYSGISTTLLPLLEHLNLYYVGAYNVFGHTNIEPLLVACTDLKSVIFGKAVLHPQASIDALILHSSHSLEKVTLTGSYTFRSVDIQQILTSCPRLRVFEALGPVDRRGQSLFVSIGRYRVIQSDPILYVQDIEFGQGEWICKELETFRVCYRNSNKGSISMPGCLRQQISKMTKLKDLRLHCNSHYDGMDDLDCVHEALKEWNTLKDLRTLELRGLGKLVDRKELAKIRKQWTKLEWVQFS